MPNTNVAVPPALGRVIDRAHVRRKSKHKALRHLMQLALADPNEFNDRDHYGAADQDSISCTLNITEGEFDGAEAYRERYNLLTRIAFLRYVLVHGATLFEAELAEVEAKKKQSLKA